MSLENINLNKLLKLFYLDPDKGRSALRADIREDLRREAGEITGGGDFYSPFWSDAKQHVFGTSDLRSATVTRINANPRRANLYPQLRDGFLDWWDQKRRWTNQPFRPGNALKGSFRFHELDATVKAQNILTVVDALGEERAVYAYCFPDPPLCSDAARLGMWLLAQALTEVPASEHRILDMIRGYTFSDDRVPLSGEEEIEFQARFARLIRERDMLREQHY